VNDVPDLGPMPQRVTVSAEQAGRLVAEQFPPWATLPVTAVENGGWDNRTFRLGDTMLLRLPSAEEYALAVEKEHRWLPELAPALRCRLRPGKWCTADLLDGVMLPRMAGVVPACEAATG